MSERYIVIPNWETFQHYKDRSPLWIKNYTELLHDDAYLGLTGHQRGVLHGLWLEYASARAHITLNTRSLTRRLGVRVMTRDLDALSHAGFITFSASPPLAPRYPRVEKSREEPPSSPPAGDDRNPLLEDEQAEEKELSNGNGRGKGWVDNLGSYTGCRYVRGETALHAVYDPLGTEPPPQGWPYDRPTRAEIKEALRA